MSVARGFAAYLHTLDPSAEILPPGLLPGGTHRAVPYLYSAADIASLLAQAERLRTPLRTATIQTLTGLLAVTGMRIGEALGLDDGDFDPGQGTLIVRHAKFGKQRLLPLHPTTVTALQHYRRLRDQAFPRLAQRGAAGVQLRGQAAVCQCQPDLRQAGPPRGPGCPVRWLPPAAA